MYRQTVHAPKHVWHSDCMDREQLSSVVSSAVTRAIFEATRLQTPQHSGNDLRNSAATQVPAAGVVTGTASTTHPPVVEGSSRKSLYS